MKPDFPRERFHKKMPSPLMRRVGLPQQCLFEKCGISKINRVLGNIKPTKGWVLQPFYLIRTNSHPSLVRVLSVVATTNDDDRWTEDPLEGGGGVHLRRYQPARLKFQTLAPVEHAMCMREASQV